ncbi:tyrosine-type recombinase/integrase [Hahella aquimaris]|uniref:tyrosine-type recombinase/integrase n=1 Tax=Hahella sp. HNIBRBA332 TaxID=3015983 RepID=UPI00273C8852|nr:tyrosine-type recombinase/integrase [Hahella sp. HNIBRBA332]WLQ16822.1 tyrosine-type recombinase/integrase [Hahella sp. HNIBRBA332]
MAADVKRQQTLEAGERFKLLWGLYLKHQYVNTKTHPYAFTVASGRPLSIKAYTANRKRAVERIGLQYSKKAGTTPHADRHSYGQALARAKLSPEIIKTAMHHKSLESQATYTEPTEKDIRKAFMAAERALNCTRGSI